MKAVLRRSEAMGRRKCMPIALFLLAALLASGACAESALDKVDEIVFVARKGGADGHWYANFGYYALDTADKAYLPGAQLCRLNLKTGAVTVLIDDLEGGIRDPKIHYDGKKILFSYRKGKSPYFHLHEINIDGTGLTRLTGGPFDDIEPTYLPDGGIMFVSSRCKRWVNCWATQVANLHRCDSDGSNILQISSNGEHDNTPWVLPDGRILYQRWEYIDRSQVHYHHLWTSNPDGTGQMNYYGNMHAGTLMIDAKPIPGTDKVVSIFSPGHGRREHEGAITVVSPKSGPDHQPSARKLGEKGHYRDPYPLSEDCILAAQGRRLVVLNGKGEEREIFRLSEELTKLGLSCHEPRPLGPRPRERVIPSRVNLKKSTGRLVLSDVYVGRNMTGVKRGEIDRLLVLESLPMPIHYHGGMQPITQGGTFTFERILGTVPVEPDGSAYMEVPAVRSLFFIALDKDNNAVKRMQSFLTVMPGETTSCTGCHEPRTQSPANVGRAAVQALNRPPSAIKPLEGIPQLFDFPRDIQPILDKHCVKCHGVEERKAGVSLLGDRGPVYTHSYYTLTIRGQFKDNRNQPKSNLPPRALGAQPSPLMRKVLQGHHGVALSQHEKDMIRFWIESGAVYPGTSAALGGGMIGHTLDPRKFSGKPKYSAEDQAWESTKIAREALDRRCGACHQGDRVLSRTLSENRGRGQYSRYLTFNLTRPEKSLTLLGPLARGGGGLGLCRELDDQQKPAGPVTVFADTADPDYQKILAMCVEGRKHLETITWFHMAEFRPTPEYAREMKRYGVLPKDLPADATVDPYATDRAYWESLWWKPNVRNASE